MCFPRELRCRSELTGGSEQQHKDLSGDRACDLGDSCAMRVQVDVLLQPVLLEGVVPLPDCITIARDVPDLTLSFPGKLWLREQLVGLAGMCQGMCHD